MHEKGYASQEEKQAVQLEMQKAATAHKDAKARRETLEKLTKNRMLKLRHSDVEKARARELRCQVAARQGELAAGRAEAAMCRPAHFVTESSISPARSRPDEWSRSSTESCCSASLSTVDPATAATLRQARPTRTPDRLEKTLPGAGSIMTKSRWHRVIRSLTVLLLLAIPARGQAPRLPDQSGSGPTLAGQNTNAVSAGVDIRTRVFLLVRRHSP